MNLNIDLPDWVEEEKRAIYIMAGIETVAYKMPGENWKVKSVRCSQCGKCCQNFGEQTGELKSMVESGNCKYLVSDGEKLICSLGSSRPFNCSIGTCVLKECTEKYDTLL